MKDVDSNPYPKGCLVISPIFLILASGRAEGPAACCQEVCSLNEHVSKMSFLNENI